MATWFTSDTHFGHDNIRSLCKRPFVSCYEMDGAMIHRWNTRVRADDTVYHLGDFSFRDPEPYRRQLNGEIVLLLGNHDGKRIHPRKYHLFKDVDKLLETDIDETRVVMCHYAMRVWNRSHHGALHLYGHSHGSLPGDSQSCDVGVDCWDFRPVSLTEIKARLATLPQRGHKDHHQPPKSP